jgi:hypothetical protein
MEDLLMDRIGILIKHMEVWLIVKSIIMFMILIGLLIIVVILILDYSFRYLILAEK